MIQTALKATLLNKYNPVHNKFLKYHRSHKYLGRYKYNYTTT
jgi:hypothetical protein